MADDSASPAPETVALVGAGPGNPGLLTLRAVECEAAEALRQAGVPYEIVPGVTAALGAAAFAGIPLTHRLHASAVALVTGHEKPEKEGGRIDWARLADFPGTLVIYMGVLQLPRIV